MAIKQGKKLLSLPLISTLTGAENFYVVDDSGNSKRAIISSLVDLINTEISVELNNVAITGGSINGTEIGNVTPSSGVFTSLNVTSSITLPNNSIQNSNLQNSSITVNTSNGITGGGTVELGSTISISINEIDGGIF